MGFIWFPTFTAISFDWIIESTNGIVANSIYTNIMRHVHIKFNLHLHVRVYRHAYLLSNILMYSSRANAIWKNCLDFFYCLLSAINTLLTSWNISSFIPIFIYSIIFNSRKKINKHVYIQIIMIVNVINRHVYRTHTHSLYKYKRCLLWWKIRSA